MHNSKQKEIKCVVWDLDNTLWHGILAENDEVCLRQKVVHIIRTLDNRGILQSIASKNDYNCAMAKLEELGLKKFFLYPQINWNSKASSIRKIADSINIGIDTIAFVDDQPFELHEVNFTYPEVLCIDAAHLDSILNMPQMNPRFITEDSRNRRIMYLTDIERKLLEESFEGPKESFLVTLDMVFAISEAKEEDLKRAEELTIRTNQLNTTGYTYSYEELNQFRLSISHKLLIASLTDKFGPYGKIGLALIETRPDIWIIKLLVMSCRVMTRGVGTVFINYIRKKAKRRGVRLQAEMIPSDRNRMMYITYKFSSFKEIEQNDNFVILENDLSTIQEFPEYIKVEI